MKHVGIFFATSAITSHCPFLFLPRVQICLSGNTTIALAQEFKRCDRLRNRRERKVRNNCGPTAAAMPAGRCKLNAIIQPHFENVKTDLEPQTQRWTLLTFCWALSKNPSPLGPSSIPSFMSSLVWIPRGVSVFLDHFTATVAF